MTGVIPFAHRHLVAGPHHPDGLSAALDATLAAGRRRPTHGLTGHQESVAVVHVARVPVGDQQVVVFGRLYGGTVHTCQPPGPGVRVRGA